MGPQEKLIKSCEEDIRAGRTREARDRLASLNAARVPRRHRLALANLCRRAGLVHMGLRLLSPVVYPHRKNPESPATSPELAEYSALLTRAGALREAAEVLDRADPSLAPEAHLFRSYIAFSRWDFAAAAASLEKLAPSEDPYAQLIGRVNLAYAYIGARRHEEARGLLDQCVSEAERMGADRLRANGLELLTRLHFQLGDLNEARASLERSQALAKGGASELWLARKWTAALQAMSAGDVKQLLDFKQAALEAKDWENAREADRLALRVTFDQARFRHLVFGTRFEAYRAELFGDFGRLAKDDVTYSLGEGKIRFDLAAGTFGNKNVFGDQNKCLQLLACLMCDFYGPIGIGEVFGELFSGERFNPLTSPHRVHQLVYRTRGLLENAKVPLAIEIVDSGSYRVRIGAGLTVSVPLEARAAESYHVYHDYSARLAASFAEGEVFSLADARERLEISRTTFFRFSKWAFEHGLLEKLEDGLRRPFSAPRQLRRAG